MSLRWEVRVDIYQRGDEQIKVLIRKIFCKGYELKVNLDYYEDFDDDGGPFLCTNIIVDHRLFETQTSLEMFINRLKKQLCFSVDGLLERTYYFGRQNSHYEKE